MGTRDEAVPERFGDSEEPRVAGTTSMTADELAERDARDAERLARPREQMNGAERAYLDAREHLLSGAKPRDADNLRKWSKGTLTCNPTSVAREADCSRAPIAGHNGKYGYIFRLIERDGDAPIRRADVPPEVGPRGFERSLQQLRSNLAALSRRTELAEAKGANWDKLIADASATATQRRARRGGRGGADAGG